MECAFRDRPGGIRRAISKRASPAIARASEPKITATAWRWTAFPCRHAALDLDPGLAHAAVASVEWV